MSTEGLLRRAYTAPPITVPVTTTPVQVQVSEPPYTVINLGTESDDTIWLADNPGVQVSQGTPLYPGTSLQWNRPGRLWAVGESAATMLVSYDVTDWEPNPVAIATAILNSGVILVDQPTLLFNGNRDNNATDIFDIRTFQSLIVSISPVDLITYPTCPRYENIFFATTEGLFVLFKRIIKFADNGFGWTGVLPCVGAAYRLSAVGATSGADIQIWGSHRPLHLMQDHNHASDGNFLYSSSELVTAGGNSIIPMPSYIGTVEIHVTVSAGNHANSGVQIETVQGSTNTAYHRAAFGVPYGTPSELVDVGSKPVTITLAGQAWRLRIDNGDVADRTFRVFVTPVTSPAGNY